MRAGASRDSRVQREQLDRLQRETQRQREEDVICEHPRRLILRSPDGTYFALTVDDAGALSTTSLGTSL